MMYNNENCNNSSEALRQELEIIKSEGSQVHQPIEPFAVEDVYFVPQLSPRWTCWILVWRVREGNGISSTGPRINCAADAGGRQAFRAEY